MLTASSADADGHRPTTTRTSRAACRHLDCKWKRRESPVLQGVSIEDLPRRRSIEVRATPSPQAPQRRPAPGRCRSFRQSPRPRRPVRCHQPTEADHEQRPGEQRDGDRQPAGEARGGQARGRGPAGLGCRPRQGLLRVAGVAARRRSSPSRTATGWCSSRLRAPAARSSSAKGVTSAPPGSFEGLHLAVYDIDAARADLIGRGVEVSEPFHDVTGRLPSRRDRGARRAARRQDTPTTARSPPSATRTATAGCSRRSRPGFRAAERRG